MDEREDRGASSHKVRIAKCALTYEFISLFFNIDIL